MMHGWWLLNESKFLARSCTLFKLPARLKCHSVKLNEKESLTLETTPQLTAVNFASPVPRTQLYAWGLLEHGALGLDQESSRSHARTFRYKHKPTRHFFGEANCISNIDCGYGFTAFSVRKKTDTFKVFGSGINTDSQIGFHDPRKDHPLGIILSPAPINLGIEDCTTEIISLAAGRAHLVVVTDKEGVFTLGSNCYGQCGRPVIPDEKYNASSYVHKIEDLDGSKVCSAVCGQDHTLLLTDEGKVYSCGLGADGQTGLGCNDNVHTPTLVRGAIANEKIVQLAGKCDSIMALNNCGEVFGWGNTEYYQFTDKCDDSLYINSPVRLDKVNRIGKIIDIAVGGSFCMVLNSCGDVYVWGYGVLGTGPSVTQSPEPLLVPRTLFGYNEFQPDTKVVSIACGLNHMAAINNYDSLHTWGKNSQGCLGVGHVRDQFFPYKVCIGAQVQYVSCGVDHTMAVCKGFV